MKEPTTLDSHWQPIQFPLELSLNVVHAIRLKLDLPFDKWSSLDRFLTEDERIRAARFRFDEPRRRFIICRSTLRQILGQCCGIEPRLIPLSYNNHGKPELVFSESEARLFRKIEFSVSHSGEFGLIAIAVESPVGIDVEEFNSSVKILKLAERFFASQEATELGELPPQKQLAGFYRCWTCKEAYIKAKGNGLAMSLSSFRVTTDPDQSASLCHIDDQPDEPAQWTVSSLDVAQDYAAAVMVARPNCRIECWDWSAG